jgi:hypothetical protein
VIAVLEAVNNAIQEWVAAGESLEFEAEQAEWQCNDAVANAMCAPPTNCGDCCR